jgi:chromosome segregation ATPase
MKTSRKIGMISLAIAAAVTAMWFTMRYRSGGNHDRLIQLEQENRELKSALEKLRAENTTLPHAREDGPASGMGKSLRDPIKRALPSADDTETYRVLRESLASANQSLEEWKARGAELQTQLDQLKEDHKRLVLTEARLTEQLASAEERAATTTAELSRKNDQIVSLEATNKKLVDATRMPGQRDSQLSQTSNELQEIYRRRESYLNTLIGRYREVTEQYRAFVNLLENRRGPEGTPGASISIAGPELARIQNSIAMAEEDIRQLNTLSVQALRLQKKLSGK